MSAGDQIRTAREAAGKTQEDVALALRVTEGAVSQWEVGRTTPRRATAFKLDKYLGADGLLVAALGYAAPSPEGLSQLVGLRAEVRSLRLAVRELQLQLLPNARNVIPPTPADGEDGEAAR